MKNKAYIVANEEQEREVLEKFEREGLVWGFDEKPTEWSPVQDGTLCRLPYALITNGHVGWLSLSQLTDEEIVFDGRKEENMSEKYVVSQEFMNKLEEWKHDLILEDTFFVNQEAINNMPKIIKNWWVDDDVTIGESNKRLISIIRYMSGANDFEVEKPKKWVVRSKEVDSTYCYAQLLSENNNTLFMGYSFANATRFDTKEEAESWANSHQEVVEVVDV